MKSVVEHNEEVIGELRTKVRELEERLDSTRTAMREKARQVELSKQLQQLTLDIIEIKNESTETECKILQLTERIKAAYSMGKGSQRERLLQWESLVSKQNDFRDLKGPLSARVADRLGINQDYLRLAVDYYRSSPQPRLAEVCADSSVEQTLGCFLNSRPEVRYFKGLELVVAKLQQLMGQFGALRVLVSLSQEDIFFGFMRFDPAAMDYYYRVFEQLLARQNPKLAKRLEERRFHCSVYFLRWVLYLFNFVDERILLMVVESPERSIMNVGLAIMNVLKHELKRRKFKEYVDILMSWQKYVDITTLHEHLQRLAYSSSQYQALKKEAQ